MATTGQPVITLGSLAVDQATVTFWLAVISFVVSVPILGALRLYEFFYDRVPHLSVTTHLTSDSTGHEVILLNASKVPASIYYYDLVCARRGLFGKNSRFGRKVLRIEFDLEGDPVHVAVDAHSQTSISFRDQDHFNWGETLKHDLYIRLWMVGSRRPLWLWVTGPS